MPTLAEQKENRAKWVAALRSGKYRQGKRQLQNPDGSYCCLGVACLVMGFSPQLWIYGADLNGPTLEPVRDALGLRTASGGYRNGSESLVNDNDKWGLPFDKIADIIESEPEGLFVTDGDSK